SRATAPRQQVARPAQRPSAPSRQPARGDRGQARQQVQDFVGNRTQANPRFQDFDRSQARAQVNQQLQNARANFPMQRPNITSGQLRNRQIDAGRVRDRMQNRADFRRDLFTDNFWGSQGYYPYPYYYQGDLWSNTTWANTSSLLNTG